MDELTVVKELEHRYIIKMLGVGIEDKKKMLQHKRDVIGYIIYATRSKKMVYLVMEFRRGEMHTSYHVILLIMMRVGFSIFSFKTTCQRKKQNQKSINVAQ